MKLLFDDRALQTDLVRTDRIVPIASFAGLEILTLRHQLNILRRKSPKRPTFGSIDRLVFTGLYGLAPSLLSALAIVRPKTVIHWHREADRRRGNRSLGVTRSTKGKWRTRRNILCFVSIRQSQAAGKDVARVFLRAANTILRSSVPGRQALPCSGLVKPLTRAGILLNFAQTRRSAGRSLAQMCKPLGTYLSGWKAYFRLTEAPGALADIDGWVRHRLRAVQLKHWKRGRVIYRELVARGMPADAARKVAGNSRRWWHNSAMALNRALPNTFFNQLGVPPIAS